MSRLSLIKLELAYAVTSYRDRVYRCAMLVLSPWVGSYAIQQMSLTDRLAHLVLLVADILLLPELYSIVMIGTKTRTRPLTIDEQQTINMIYGQTLDLATIKVDDRAVSFTRALAIAYVSFHTINYWQRLSPAILVHECMHVLQYRRLGSVYIYEALKAQRSPQGYAYGGQEQLQYDMMMGKRLADYNLEQQAEIMEDAYLYIHDSGALPPCYAYMVEQLDHHYT